jgi:hypothetical protein
MMGPRRLRTRSGTRSEGASGPRKLSQLQMGIGLLLGIAGAIIGTVVFLIVVAIIVGLADGH